MSFHQSLITCVFVNVVHDVEKLLKVHPLRRFRQAGHHFRSLALGIHVNVVAVGAPLLQVVQVEAQSVLQCYSGGQDVQKMSCCRLIHSVYEMTDLRHRAFLVGHEVKSGAKERHLHGRQIVGTISCIQLKV